MRSKVGPCAIQLARLLLQQARLHLNPCCTQSFHAAAFYPAVRVEHGRVDFRDSRSDYRVGAGRRSALVVAGFERHVQFRTPRRAACAAKCFNFCMISSGGLMPALPDYSGIFYDNGADKRVRPSPTGGTPCKSQSTEHKAFFIHLSPSAGRPVPAAVSVAPSRHRCAAYLIALGSDIIFARNWSPQADGAYP